VRPKQKKEKTRSGSKKRGDKSSQFVVRKRSSGQDRKGPEKPRGIAERKTTEGERKPAGSDSKKRKKWHPCFSQKKHQPQAREEKASFVISCLEGKKREGNQDGLSYRTIEKKVGNSLRRANCPLGRSIKKGGKTRHWKDLR